MRYDEGGWETRMPDGGRGWDQGHPDPRRGGEPVDRPWVGGYREGYQGGSGGYALRTTGPLYESYGASNRPPERERGYRRPRGSQGSGGRHGGYFVRARAGYGNDFAGLDQGDRFAYGDAAGGTDFGPGNARPGFGQLGHLDGGRQNTGRGRYGSDFSGGRAARGGYGRDLARGTGGGGYGTAFSRGTGGGGYGRDFGRGTGGGGYGTDFARPAGGGGYDRPMRGGGGGYDLPFRNQGRPEDYHPHYSPVGGTYAPMGGSYLAGHVPRPLADSRWTSEWTRWF